MGLRFQDVTIPAGSVINSASIQFKGTTTDVGILTVPVLGELSPDPVEFGDLTPLTGRTLTTSSVQWTMDPWVLPNDVLGPNTTTPDLTAIVQEILDQNLWEAGNSMAFILQNDPMDTSERIAASFDGNPAEAALLVIDYSPPAILLGDVNLDGTVNFLDISAFITLLSTGAFQAEADIDQNGTLDFLDISPFIAILSGQ